MKDSLTRDNKSYISTSLAADLTGYSQDYIGQLAREDNFESIKADHRRFVNRDELFKYAEENKKGFQVNGLPKSHQPVESTVASEEIKNGTQSNAGEGLSSSRISNRWRQYKRKFQEPIAGKNTTTSVLPSAVISVAVLIILLSGFVTMGNSEDDTLAFSSWQNPTTQQAALGTMQKDTLLETSLDSALDSVRDSLRLTHALGEVILSPLQSMFADASRFAWRQFRDFGEVIVANPDYAPSTEKAVYSPTQSSGSGESASTIPEDSAAANEMTDAEEGAGSSPARSGSANFTNTNVSSDFDVFTRNDAALTLAVEKLTRLTIRTLESGGSEGGGSVPENIDERFDDLRDLLYANDESILDAADYDHPDDIDLQELTADSVAATSGTFASITVEDGFSSGATTSVSGEFQTKDDTIIGDEASDDLTVNAGLASDLDPATTSTYSLGSSTNRFLSGYFSDLLSAETVTSSSTETTDLTTENATSTNLFAIAADFTSAFIENLTATVADFVNLEAENATTTDLFAQNSTTTNATATNSYIENLQADDVEIENIDTESATTTDLYVRDDTTLGDDNGDTVVVNSRFSSDLVPSANATFDIGSQSFFWDNAYVDNLTANNISAASSSISGTAAENFTINSDNSSQDREEMSLIFFRGQVNPNAILRWDNLADRFSFNQPLTVWNESGSTTIPTISGRGTSGQTANLLELASSSGAVLTAVRPDGTIVAPTASTTDIQTTNLSAENSTTSNATTTDGYVENLESENATSTNLFAAAANFTMATIDTLTATLGDFVNLEAENATTTNLVSSDTRTEDLSASGTANLATTNVADLSVSGNATGQEADQASEFVTLSQLSSGADSTDSFLQDGNSFGQLAVLGTNDAQEIAFETNDTEQVRIDTDGNVGIGTTDPDTALEVAGETQSNFFSATDLSATSTFGNVLLQDEDGDSRYSLTQEANDILTLQRSGGTDKNFSILEVEAPESTPNEATLTLMRDTAAGNAFLDLYNNGYDAGLDSAQQFGLRIQERGNETYRPFVIDFYDGSTYSQALYVATSSGAVELGNIGLGTTTPEDRLTVAGNVGLAAGNTYRINGTDILAASTTLNSYYVGEGAGANNTASALNAFGFEAGINNEGENVNAFGDNAARVNDGKGVNALGFTAGYANDADDVNVFGRRAGYFNAGKNANLFGYFAGRFNEGVNVNALGFQAAMNNTGNNVNALGSEAAEENTGVRVNALGFKTAENNTGADLNAIGSYAAQDNIGVGVNAFGLDAARFNTGDNVTAIGGEAGNRFAGGQNTALGYRAAYTGVSADTLDGLGNTFLGANTDYANGAINNSTAVGAGVTLTDSNTVVLGDGANVGVGTTSPQEKLSVVGDGSFTGTVSGAEAAAQDEFVTLSQLSSGADSTDVFLQDGNSFGTLATLGTNDANDLAIETAGTERVRVDTDGNVGIGTTTPNDKLSVYNGDITINRDDGLLPSLSLVSDGGGPFSIDHGGSETYFRNISDGTLLLRGSQQNDLASFNYEAPENSFVLGAAGNIGLGTATPQNTLSVAGSGRFTDGSVIIDQDTDPTLTFAHGGVTDNLIFDTDLDQFSFQNDFAIEDFTPAIEMIDSNNQNWQLDASNGFFKIEDETTPSEIFTLTAGAPENSFYMDGGGNVGLGTSTPDEQLELAEDGRIKLSTALSNLDASSLLRLQWTATSGKPAIGWFDEVGDRQAAIVAHHSSSLNDNVHKHLSFETADSAGALQTRLDIDWGKDQSQIKVSSADLKVGAGNEFIVGTDQGLMATSSFYGDIYGYGTRDFGIGNKDWATAGLETGAKWEFYREATDAELLVNTADANDDSALRLRTGTKDWRLTNTGTDLTLGAEGVEFVRVAEDTGNVGIGTSNTDEKLSVDGNGDFTGTVSGAEAGEQDEFVTLSQLSSGSASTDAFLQDGNSFGSLATLGTNDANDLAIETNDTEQVRIDTSGNVGIGTTNPVKKLVVQRDSGTSSVARFLGNAGVSALDITAASNYGGIQGRGDAMNPSALVLNSAGGNVGVGTTNPASALDVAGVVTANELSINDYDLTGYSGGLQLLYNSVNDGQESTYRILGGGADTLNVELTDGDLTVPNGNVGIGTESPETTLDVNGVTQSETINITSPNSPTLNFERLGSNTWRQFVAGNNDLYLEPETTDAQLRVRNQANTDIFSLDTANSQAYFAGDVGIGTENPQNALQIGNYDDVDRTLQMRSSAGSYFALKSNGSTAVQSIISGSRDADNTEIAFETADGGGEAEAVRIDSAGQVGIGTTDPRDKLDVEDSTERLIRFNNTASGLGAWRLNQLTSAGQFALTYSNNAPYFAIDNGGDVGIGTTNPDRLLELSGQNDGLRISDEDNSNFYTDITQADSSFSISRNGTGGSDLQILSTGETLLGLEGNVGVGTTNPNETLHIEDGIPSILLDDAGGRATEFRQNGDQFSIRDRGNNSPVLLADTSQNPVAVEFRGPVNMATVAGNVGIGTTNPSSKLTVQDGNLEVDKTDGSSSANLFLNTNNELGNNFLLANGGRDVFFKSFGPGGNGGQFIFRNGNNDNIVQFDYGAPEGSLYLDSAGQVGVGVTNPSADLEVSGSELQLTDDGGGASIKLRAGPTFTGLETNGSSDPMIFYNGETERMRLRPGGNFGINDSFPSQKLSVGGEVRINGFDDRLLFGNNDPVYVTSRSAGNNSTRLEIGRNFSIDDADQPYVTVDAAGRVGIGETNPAAELEIRGATSGGGNGLLLSNAFGTEVARLQTVPNSANRSELLLKEGSTGDTFIRFGTTGDNYIDSGFLGINRTNPAQQLDVNGTIRQNNALSCELAANSNGDLICSGTSDRTLKTDIDSLDSASSLAQINELEGKTFRFRPEAQLGDQQEIGFIAQDVERIFPELVGESRGFKYIRYDKLTAVLAEGLQEVDEKITKMQEAGAESFWREPARNMGEREPTENFIAAVGATLEDFATDVRAQFEEVWAERVVAEEELCVGETCVSESELKTLLENQAQHNTSESDTANESDGMNTLDPRDEGDDSEEDTASGEPSGGGENDDGDQTDSDTSTTTPASDDTAGSSTASTTDDGAEKETAVASSSNTDTQVDDEQADDSQTSTSSQDSTASSTQES